MSISQLGISGETKGREGESALDEVRRRRRGGSRSEGI